MYRAVLLQYILQVHTRHTYDTLMTPLVILPAVNCVSGAGRDEVLLSLGQKSLEGGDFESLDLWDQWEVVDPRVLDADRGSCHYGQYDGNQWPYHFG